MAQTIFLALMTLIFVVLGINERNFLANAKKQSASIVHLFTSVIDDETSGKRVKEFAKRAEIKLNPNASNEREADVTLPDPVWKNAKPGDTMQIWAYSDHPKWVFWSPMVRYEHVEIFVKINFALAGVLFILTMLSLNAMRV